MIMRSVEMLILLVLASTAVAAAVPQQPASPASPVARPDTAQAPAPTPAAPGVAPQMQESHGDWRVICASPNNQKMCAISQQLSDKVSGQRVLGIEVRAATADRLTVTIVLPFGLAVDKPVTIKIDEGAPMSLPFKTCIQIGCVVTTTWEPPVVATLKKAMAIYVNALTADKGQDVAFRVSLNGFGAALDRAVVLAKP